MNGLRLYGRTTVLASLLALGLLLGSALMGITALGSSASAGEPGAVFYGYVVPESGHPLPKRVRAVTETGTVCGSAELTPVASGGAGFYAMTVFSGDMHEGCPATGEPVRFLLVYGLIDEGILVGEPSVFRGGDVTEHHLVRTAADTRLALP